MVLKGVAAAMMWCRTKPCRAPLGAFLIASGLLAGPGLSAAAAVGDVLLQPTPLILKDGRIANVSVHVVAFGHGQAAMDTAVTQQLHLMTEEVATDCFLTAQVIGHVGSAEVAENDTLNAHRLARSRADAVQASLIEAGLPAKAIASVWDWQFMVRDARATLWVFRLTPGEDCEGAPLDAAARALVAEAQPIESNVAPQTASPAGAFVGSAAAQEPAGQAAAAPAPARTAPAPAPVVTRPAGPSPASVAMATPGPSVTQALPAASASTSEQPAAAARDAGKPDRVVAALPEQPAPAPAPEAPVAAAPVEVAAKPKPDSATPAATGKEQRLTIVFPTNSSYFPPGAGQQLRSLLRTLGEGGNYEVVLQSSVSSSQVVGAENAEEARRYNQWLATRRLERVQDWLARHAAGRALTIKPDYRPNDDSREVAVRVRPIG